LLLACPTSDFVLQVALPLSPSWRPRAPPFPRLPSASPRPPIKPADSSAGFLSAECQPHHEAAGPARRLFLLRLSWSRSISPALIAPRGCCHEDLPSGRWPAICCCWAFLFRTRDRIAHMAAQCCNGRLRRGHRSRRFRPCLVRMAVSARAHLDFTPAGFLLPVAFAAP
jgi:hypothetical protein